jgi:hypothetical protein
MRFQPKPYVIAFPWLWERAASAFVSIAEDQFQAVFVSGESFLGIRVWDEALEEKKNS